MTYNPFDPAQVTRQLRAALRSERQLATALSSAIDARPEDAEREEMRVDLDECRARIAKYSTRLVALAGVADG